VTAARAVAIAVTFIWLGMVVAISFIETPLKFRAPGITMRLGLGIGRLVFRALNTAELLLAAVVLAAVFTYRAPLPAIVAVLGAVAALIIQVLVVRRWLNRRTDAVLAGAQGPRSRGHFTYIGLEVIKVAALLVTGIELLAG
jgi:hypothetical protein